MLAIFRQYLPFGSGGFLDTDDDGLPRELDRCTVAGRFRPNFIFPQPAFVTSALAWITDLSAFQALFINNFKTPVKESVLTNPVFIGHLNILRDRDNILEASSHPKFWNRYFEVPKKPKMIDGQLRHTSRAIFNGRALSESMQPPPPVNLPEIPTILRRLNELSFDQLAVCKGDKPYVMTADLRHYFHQFPVAPNIREYFSIACAGKTFQYKVLSMGWSYSPRIAQCVTWGFLLDNPLGCWASARESALASAHPPTYAICYVGTRAVGLLFVWYDNIVFICFDKDCFFKSVQKFKAAASRCNLEWSALNIYQRLDDGWRRHHDLEINTEDPPAAPVFLGITLRYSGRAFSWCTDEVFRNNAHQLALRLQTQPISKRMVARAVGKIVWDTYIRCRTFVSIADIIALGSKNSRHTVNWLDATPLEAEDLGTLANALHNIHHETWTSLTHRPHNAANRIHVCTDSSGSKMAFVTFDERGVVREARFTHIYQNMLQESIFLKELLAVVWWAEDHRDELLRDTTSIVCLATDNTAVSHVILRGLSTVHAANELLSRLFRCIEHERIEVVTVPTADNAADPLTRNQRLDQGRNQRTFNAFLRYFEGCHKTDEIPWTNRPAASNASRHEPESFDNIFPDSLDDPATALFPKRQREEW